MRILFIGGTGNISAECADLLARQGHEICILSRGRTAVPSGFRALKADRKDLASMRNALQGLQPEIVLNFLGYEVSDLELDFQLFRDRLKQYIFISSATVYTKPAARLPITEEAPLGNSLWDYAQK